MAELDDELGDTIEVADSSELSEISDGVFQDHTYPQQRNGNQGAILGPSTSTSANHGITQTSKDSSIINGANGLRLTIKLPQVSTNVTELSSIATKSNEKLPPGRSLAPKPSPVNVQNNKMQRSNEDHTSNNNSTSIPSSLSIFHGEVPSTGPQTPLPQVMSEYNDPTSTVLQDSQSASKSSRDRSKEYTLENGSTVSGKGLGKGRPGMKRGPRSLTNLNGDVVASEIPALSRTASTPSVLASPNKKRKRTDSESSNVKIRLSTTSSLTSASRESSVEYNPTASQTRSGRQTQKPTTYVPPVTPAASSPAIKRTQSGSAGGKSNNSPASIKSHPKIKRRVYRGREQFALCEHCLRGHGPVGNVIVFCDACNKCWHQRCHDPIVSQDVIADTKAEWFCSECDKILHGNKKSKKAAPKSNTNIPPTIEPPKPSGPMTFTGPLIGGAGLSKEQKLKYLNTLSKERLVSVIMNASDLAPTLPLFHTPVPVVQPAPLFVPQPQFTSNYVTPVSDPPPILNPGNVELPDEGYDEDYDEGHAALYPKPGFGIKLPPESVDMHMLLESKTSKTFSHWIRSGIRPI